MNGHQKRKAFNRSIAVHDTFRHTRKDQWTWDTLLPDQPRTKTSVSCMYSASAHPQMGKSCHSTGHNSPFPALPLAKYSRPPGCWLRATVYLSESDA
mmetsp:Transcript_14481/g.14338  ORF Transcript_14481/g.14338 Transcript_14481/m.14338 type:complete len:97 (-) Transcript_14481:56-346(-)